MISVIIPTRNRPTDLILTLRKISVQSLAVSEVIVIDSSDQFTPLRLEATWRFKLIHQYTAVKSAAVQRNIGMELVQKNCSFLCFLDDDVQPSVGYVSELVGQLLRMGGIGISGVALNPLKQDVLRRKPVGLFGTTQRFFGLDSIHDGILLKSGVNIPVRIYNGNIQRVEWLIGCSIWRYKEISDLRFESDFMGQSLCEDVIFSIRAGLRGLLYVYPSTHLDHTESNIGRPLGLEFWSMWVVNRKRVIDVAFKGKTKYFWFHFSNLGQFLSLIYAGIFVKKSDICAAIGIPFGYWQLLVRRFIS